MWIKKNAGPLMIVLISFLPGIIFWGSLPSQIPSHWGANGHVNATMPRLEAVFFGPGINLILFGLFLFLPKIDPKRENYAKFQKTYAIFRWLIHLFLTLLQIFIIWNAVQIKNGNPSLNINTIIPPFIGILFIVLGNYTTRVRHNYFVGIRTPWALADEVVWRKTNRFGGRVLVINGLIAIISLLFPSTIRFYIFLVPLFIGLIITFVYSYIVFPNRK